MLYSAWNTKDTRIEHAADFRFSENSDRAFEEEVMLSGFANAQVKGEGSRLFHYDQRSRNFHFSLHSRNNSSCISQSLKKRLKTICMTDLASRYTKALARSMANTKQVKAANVLNNAFNSKLTLVEIRSRTYVSTSSSQL
jgi:hypothetical protein